MQVDAIQKPGSINSGQPTTEVSISAAYATSDAWSINAPLPLLNFYVVSPLVSSPPSVATMTYVSLLANRQQEFATCVKAMRPLVLLIFLTNYVIFQILISVQTRKGDVENA